MKQTRKRFDRWKDKYNWGDCGLNNGEYGSYLSSYLRTQKTPLVLNLNGSWGTGKTHFLKQLYVDLLYDNNYPTVYINAWESDFTNDPLLVIISELLEQLNSIHPGYSGVTESLHRNLGQLAKRGWNGVVDVAAAYVSTKQDDFDSTALLGMTQHIKFDQQSDPKLGKSLTDNYRKQLAAIRDTHDCLSAYVESFPESKRKVFVLVDELDRCRPTYSIEMLETIKHFFSMENYVFVVATDTDALSHSIKAVYGSTFDGKEYLSRFFNRSAALPEPDRRLFAKLLVDKSTLAGRIDEIVIFGEGEPTTASISTIVYEVGVMYDLSLRRMSQVFNKVEATILYELETQSRLFDIRLLMQLVAEFDSVEFKVCYDARRQSDGVAYDLPKKMKEKYGFNTNSSENMALRINGRKLTHPEVENKDYVKVVEDHYSFSWKFANLFDKKGPRQHLNVRFGLDTLRGKMDDQMSRRDNAHTGIAGLDSTSGMRLLSPYFEHFKVLCDLHSEQKGLWGRDDYFKAVELSSSIVRDVYSTD
ncbi:P-loop NTPase fold protein [Vibrio natriegens]|uniref:KAP family P-loop NTPase fold protein n=1 Tax=Vibrio natriegens TaxID=691 RepID=UPI0022841124|nr:P-loop NTPase fold protein [Vibrio natriegens]MCY9877650.1 P-loop NTPase fold protein [Vibrio natriegens]